MRRVYYFLRWCGIFAKALVKANIDVAKIVLSPAISIRPGIVAVPMEAETDFEITLLANAITLTPGTITVHVDQAERMLLVHALDVGDDPDAIRRDVRETLEANILAWTRPSRGDRR